MAWCRAVWIEENIQEEGVIPSVWVDEHYVYYPSGINVLKTYREQTSPDPSWNKFVKLKEKVRDDERELCENFDFSTSNEVENVDENEDIMSKKKKKLIPRPDLSLTYSDITNFKHFSTISHATKRPSSTPDRSSKLFHVSKKLGNMNEPLKSSLDKINKRDSPEHFDFTTSNEVENMDENEDIMSKKKKNLISRPDLNLTYPGIKNLKSFSNMSNATKRPLITHDRPSKLLLVSKETIPENKNAPLKSSIAEIISKKAIMKSTTESSCQIKKLNPTKLPIEEGKFQYKVLHLLTEIRDEMESIKKILKSENSSLNVVQIDTLKEFIKFDESLSDKEAEKNIKHQLSNVGGSSAYATVKAMLVKLMSNKLMSLFNLAGRSKESFRKTNLMKIIIDCAPNGLKENEVQSVVGNILKRAPDRKNCGGRHYSSAPLSSANYDTFKDVDSENDDLQNQTEF